MATTAPDSGTSWKPLTDKEKKNIKGAITVAQPIYTTPSAPAAPATSGGYDNSGSDKTQALLAQIRAEQERQVNAAYKQGKQSLDNAKLAADKDAYIALMRGLKNMPQISAVSGNGGYAQSLLNKQELNYENNRSNIAQKYFDDLRALELNRDNGLISASQDYLGGLATLVKSSIPKASTAANTTAGSAFTGKYKVGNKTLSRDEYLKYLAGYGMDAEAAAEYMQKYKIPY